MRPRRTDNRRTRWSVLVVAIAVVTAACSGSGNGSSAADTAAPQDGAVTALVDVRGAVIRIEVTGSFVYPEEGTLYNEGFTGSGFFISSDGLAVTNNHVVTGAAFLQVFVEGEDEPRNATILGVSECSDLAVIDVDGDGFEYLTWYEDELTVGTKVYAAGYPLGDEEYTLLDGIISKEKTDGESSWASIDAVLEHTADILPGNSGGPLVTEDGQVVGVNYADNTESQSFAIGYAEAIDVIPSLQIGEDVTSIGINGTAVSDDDGSGIWVHSVAAGSPADLVGVRGGDIVTELSGLIPGVDGTMADYCDVLRSHKPGEAIQIEVMRDGVSTYMEGTLNTDKVLAPTGSTTDLVSSPGTTVAEGDYALAVGDCVDDGEVDNYVTGDDYFVTPCDGAHDNEVYYIYSFAPGPYPGDDAVTDELDSACRAEFEGFVGRDYESSILALYSLFPDQSSWKAGERRGECLVYDVAFTKLTGSAYQSGW
ncbi:MAG: hypothetical protein BMS9Abin07_1533 [Acidimicrobiia bacterium]|nr:MAG: hypothetical protein BMS9Abin07_1533 [Acidimicrobiia bacterium]